MRITGPKLVMAVASATLLALSACGSDTGSTDTNENGDNGGGGDHKVEVFTWWADGGEKAGLDGLVDAFKSACPDEEFVNAAVAGGAGSNAKAVLAQRLQTGDPPSTFQAHAGGELRDYIDAQQIQDLSSYYEEWGLTEAFPQSLLDNITVDGKIYSVPANVHRANVVWTNPQVLQDAGIDPAKGPADIDAWIADLDKLKQGGVDAPLAISKGFAQEQLLEAVLIADLGPEAFNGLWDGSTDWMGDDVTAAIEDYKTLLGYTNSDRESIDWPDALNYVTKGDAAYHLMGDWVAAQLLQEGVPESDYTYWPAPGTDGVFQFLSDSFVLPTNAINPEGTKCWLKTVGSAEGQKAFNTKKGSIPARADADPADYPKYQQSAMADWKTDTVVPSCAHGSACTLGENDAILSALQQFSSSQDVGTLQEQLAQAMTS